MQKIESYKSLPHSNRILLKLQAKPFGAWTESNIVAHTGGTRANAGRRMREAAKKGLVRVVRQEVLYMPTVKLINMPEKKVAKFRLKTK